MKPRRKHHFCWVHHHFPMWNDPSTSGNDGKSLGAFGSMPASPRWRVDHTATRLRAWRADGWTTCLSHIQLSVNTEGFPMVITLKKSGAPRKVPFWGLCLACKRLPYERGLSACPFFHWLRLRVTFHTNQEVKYSSTIHNLGYGKQRATVVVMWYIYLFIFIFKKTLVVMVTFYTNYGYHNLQLNGDRPQLYTSVASWPKFWMFYMVLLNIWYLLRQEQELNFDGYSVNRN